MPKFDSTQILMAIIGSLTAFMFYGRIQDASDIQSIKQEQVDQSSQLRDIWGKYNDAGAQMMNFMIEDARQKEQIKEQILQVKLEEANRELARLKAER